MPRLARKMALAKWRGSTWASEERIPADAITIDLRTASNRLSFWKLEDDTEAAERKAILAIITTLERAETIHIAFVDEVSFGDIIITDSLGDTASVELANLHVDVSELDDTSIRHVASILAKCAYGEKVKRITASKVKTTVQDAVASGTVDPNNLKPSLKKHIGV